ncbi:iron uptake transporter permease EfeU [Jatrophihabitans sp. DSM 45814]
MLPTFVIGLREGLEAALIVSIVATFLRRNGRPDLLRWVFAGVLLAVVLCAGVGIGLKVLSQNLPQRQQEGLETIIGAVAVVMVTYMVVWMRRHSRDLKGQLEGAASVALAAGSGFALVLMAFLAVLREGFETAVFLLAAFNESDSGPSAGLGALLGVLLAVALGYAIYRGGVRINLSKFFRATGVVLVLVAAGLVVTAFHTAHEAGWINSGQQQVLDLTAVVRPGSVQASLLTGMLGIQERPTVIEVVAWLAYLIPVGLYVAWPPGKAVGRPLQRRIAISVAAIAAVTAVVCLAIAPSSPSDHPVTSFGPVSAQLLGRSASTATISSGLPGSVTDGAPNQTFSAKRSASELRDGLHTEVFTAQTTGSASRGLPAEMTLAEIAERNGGRLPLGANANDTSATEVPVSYLEQSEISWWVEPQTDRIIDIRAVASVQTVAGLSIGKTPIGSPARTTAEVDRNAALGAVAQAHAAIDAGNRRQALFTAAALLGAIVVVALGWLLWLQMTMRRESLSALVAPPEREYARD